MLGIANRHGEVDATPSYIALIAGLDLDLVEQAIDRLCEPDPRSRTPDNEGRRLEALPGRGFGWTILNFGNYREKARLADKSEREVDSGRNAVRLANKKTPPLTADDRRSPPLTAAERPSDSYADSNKEKKGADAPDPEGLDLEAWKLWQGYRKLKPSSIPLAKRGLAKFGADQRAVVEQSVANGWKGLFELKASVSQPKQARSPGNDLPWLNGPIAEAS